jgi:hypothetical protein
MVTRTRHNVTLYVHCLSFYLSNVSGDNGCYFVVLEKLGHFRYTVEVIVYTSLVTSRVTGFLCYVTTSSRKLPKKPADAELVKSLEFNKSCRSLP